MGERLTHMYRRGARAGGAADAAQLPSVLRLRASMGCSGDQICALLRWKLQKSLGYVDNGSVCCTMLSGVGAAEMHSLLQHVATALPHGDQGGWADPGVATGGFS